VENKNSEFASGLGINNNKNFVDESSSIQNMKCAIDDPVTDFNYAAEFH
jgi:hypothetical protein